MTNLTEADRQRAEAQARAVLSIYYSNPEQRVERALGAFLSLAESPKAASILDNWRAGAYALTSFDADHQLLLDPVS